MENLQTLTIQPSMDNQSSRNFCESFLNARENRYVFGCNEWAESIVKHVEIDGFVDDFIEADLFYGKPVIRSHDLPKSSLVVSAIVGERPLTALRHLVEQGIRCVDYYAFQKYSNLDLKQVWFLSEFEEEYRLNKSHYERIYNMLADKVSQEIFNQILNFRLTWNIRFLEGFVNAQDRQYFESFLDLREGETFVDVGCYDAYTSLEFIKRCPSYKSIHVFEPEPSNMIKVKKHLTEKRDIHFHPYGASDEEKELRFSSSGSASSISEEGDLVIKVKRVDDVIGEPFTFIKMDIEGGEIPALLGASKSIIEHHPKLAISVYHKVDDLWKIPEIVLSMRDDYDLYLRHYTEGITETVMFFIPKKEIV